MRSQRIAVVATAAVLVGAGPGGADPPSAHVPAGETERVAVTVDAALADASSHHPAVSADGRFVAFSTAATNLVAVDTGGTEQVYVRDRVTGDIELMSVGEDDRPAAGDAYNPAITPNGRYVAFGSSTAVTVDGAAFQVYLRDRVAGTTELVSAGPEGVADTSATGASLSADGRYVAFASSATNLVASAADNGFTDVFVKDRATGTVEHVSVASDGTPGDLFSTRPAISADGRFVAFQSFATNLDPDVPADANLSHDIYVHERETRVTEKVSVAGNGSRGTSNAYCPSISADGRLVAFASASANLVPADANRQWDIFVRDRDAGRTERVSVASTGREAQGDFFFNCAPEISANGRYVVFESVALDLVDGDEHAGPDVFVHDRLSGQTEKVSVASDGTQGDRSSNNPTISADGRYVAFGSQALLVPGDRPDATTYEVYVRDRGPPLGIGAARVDPDGSVVTGWVGQQPAPVTAAAAEPAGAAADATGADLIDVALTHRPFHHDLVVRWRVASLPGVPGYTTGLQGIPVTPGTAGAPGVVYGLDLRVDGQTFRVQALAGGPAARFGLYRCDVVCEQAAELDGGIGVTGANATVTVPLAALDADLDMPLSDLHAWTALGTDPTAPMVVDEVTLDDGNVAAARVELAAGEPDDPPANFTTTVPVGPDGRFQAHLPQANTPDQVTWVRVCRGDSCSAPVQARPLG